MRKEERKIYTKCIAVMAVYIISAVYFYTTPSQAHTAQIAENVPYLDETVSVEEFTAEPNETPKKWQIREINGIVDSAMPCDDPENFKRWLETYEQETGEEARVEIDFVPDVREDVPQEVPTVQSSEVETSSEVPSERVEETVAVYSVNGETLNPDIQAYLYQRLSDYQLEWFMPYAIMIAYQESHFDQYDVSDDGLDYGLLQFRKQFWDWSRGDIFDPYAQIDVFVELMANRANAGCDVYEMISRHMQSDYGEYNADYVATVLSHERGLAIIGN